MSGHSVYKATGLGLLGVLALPLLLVQCGGDDPPRKFQDSDASTGGTGAGGTGGGSGGVGGSVGGSGGAPDGGTPCTGEAECDDGLACNGVETCTAGFCAPGSPEPDGTACTPPGGDVDGGVEHSCVGGACVGKCLVDEDCDDNDVCTGKEVCNVATNTCVSGTPLSCDDANACTTNECDPEQGCFNPLIDNDGDGHADQALGACGTDCNDNDPTIYVGAPELCDGKDNNCNSQTDELAPTWYVDCDGDDFAPAGAASVQQCEEPTTAHPSCGATGSWVATAPGTGTTDCWDGDAKAHPKTASQNNTAWSATPINGAPTSIDFDFNCDGTEEKRWTTSFVSTGATCSFQGSPFAYCTGPAGWTGTSPACGAPAQWTGCSVQTGGCKRSQSTRTQECR